MKAKKRANIFLCCCAVMQMFILGSASAQSAGAQTNDIIGLPLEQLIHIPVYTASRLSQTISDAPNAMTVIDRNMIVASGFRKISDLFKLVPGMYVSYYKGAQAIVSYHGATDGFSRRMQVMIDGRSIYLPPINSVDWASLPITVDDIQRIEVIRGPAAAAYGANSTQGVINIITKDASESDPVDVKYTHGDKGINDVTASVSKQGEAFDYRMAIGYTADNGYDNLTKSPNGLPPEPSLYNNSNDSNQARLLNFRGNYNANAGNNIDLKFGFNHDVQGVGFDDKTPSPAQPNSTNANPFHNLFINSGYVDTGWTHRLENSSKLVLRYRHLEENSHEAFPVYVSGAYYPGPITQKIETHRDEIDIQHTLPFAGSNRLVYGMNYERNQVDGQSLMSSVPAFPDVYSSFVTNDIQVYANDEWTVTHKLLLNIGAMEERDDFGYKNASPRLSANYHVTPQQTFRAGVSVAYRTPSLDERNFPNVQPGALYVPWPVATSSKVSPEKLVSHEIGYIGEFPEWSTLLDLRLFRDHLSNGITAHSGSNITFVNNLSIDYQGLEATLKKTWDLAELTLNMAYMSAASNAPALYAAGNLDMGPPLPSLSNDKYEYNSPKKSISMLYSTKIGDAYSFSTLFFYQSKYMPSDRGMVDFQPAQRRVDMRLAKQFGVGKGENGEVALVVQNIFNTAYTDYIASNVFDRRGYISIKLTW